MTDAINSNNRINTPNPATEQRSKGSPGSTSEKSSAPGSASSVVNLSTNQIMQEMDRLPDVNSDRVEAIKSALSRGEYKPDPEVIAQKFSEIEKLLP